MKLETIRKCKRKSILIGGLIILCLVSVVTYTTTRAKYRSVQSLKLATGKVIYSEYDFKVIAMYQSEDGNNYSDIETMPGSDYVINEDRSYCTTDGVTQVKGKLKTIDGNHVMTNLNKNEKCYIWFDKVLGKTSSNIVMAITNSSMYKGSKTTEFKTIATGKESDVSDANSGIFSAPDPMYVTISNPNPVTYYWRGQGETNHVVFAGKCWRIVRINGDKSMRIIYNGLASSNNTCTNDRADEQKKNVLMADWTNNKGYKYATSEGAYNKSYYVGWTYGTGQRSLSGTDSYVKKLTEDWYKDSNVLTENQRAQIATGYFCNDRNVDVPPTSYDWGTNYTITWGKDGSRFTYAGVKRLYGLYSPTFDCDAGDRYELKVGAITADEVEFAGGKGENNALYYLYTGKSYWTMTPSVWWDSAQVFAVNAMGFFRGEHVGDANSVVGLRPVINLKADTNFTPGGNGTIDNPYVVQENS